MDRRSGVLDPKDSGRVRITAPGSPEGRAKVAGMSTAAGATNECLLPHCVCPSQQWKEVAPYADALRQGCMNWC